MTWNVGDTVGLSIQSTCPAPAPGALTNLLVAPSSEQLWLRWAEATGPVTGHDVHYTSATETQVPNEATALAPTAAQGWVDAGHIGTSRTDYSKRIRNLANGTEYRVRVRAKNGSSAGPWTFGTGTPGLIPVKFQTAPNPVYEGGLVQVAVSVWPQRPTGTPADVRFPITVVNDTAEDGDYGVVSDYINMWGLNAGGAAWTFITSFQDADTDDDCVIVTLVQPLPAGFKMAENPPGGNPANGVSRVCFLDDDGGPTVSLSISPSSWTETNTVRWETGGFSQFIVTATLSAPLTHDVQIPLRDDNGFWSGMSPLVIRKGETTGTTIIPVSSDEDCNDSEVAVALGPDVKHLNGEPRWPAVVQVGSPSEVRARIIDRASTDACQKQTFGTGSRASGPYASLISNMYDWRDDVRYYTDSAHVERWDRALLALGEPVSDNTLTPMTAAEAQGYADRGWSRWEAVAAALQEIESGTVPTPDATVTISASPNPVDEGSPVRVTVTFDQPLDYGLLIPLSITDGTAESGDRGSLSGIRIESGFTSATQDLATNQDADEDDETFTVAIDRTYLPSDVYVGNQSSVTVTITDDDVTQQQQADDPPQPQNPPGQLHAALIANAWNTRDDPAKSQSREHVERWDRVLLALGEPVSDTSLTPMTATEAQGYADRGWTPWNGVVYALNTVVTGAGSDDTLFGGAAAELLVGLGGNDDLNGGGGDDELRGGSGDDDLAGGPGRDRFVFFPGDAGAKLIVDFESGDVIVLKGGGWPSTSGIIGSPTALGCCNLRYPLGGGLTVEVTGGRRLATEDFVRED